MSTTMRSLLRLLRCVGCCSPETIRSHSTATCLATTHREVRKGPCRWWLTGCTTRHQRPTHAQTAISYSEWGRACSGTLRRPLQVRHFPGLFSFRYPSHPPFPWGTSKRKHPLLRPLLQRARIGRKLAIWLQIQTTKLLGRKFFDSNISIC